MADSEQKSMTLDYAQINKMVVTDLRKEERSKILRKYKKDQVVTFLDNPQRYEKQLREISITLYNKSSHYKRLVNYFARTPLLSYIVEPFGIDTTKANTKSLLNQFRKVNDLLDLMNIKHEFLKVLVVAFREDVFYGYEHMNKDSYFIQKLDPDYCRLSSIEDGVYNFAYDFTYFDTFPEKLDTWPKEFKSKYNKYKNGSSEGKWIELDSTNTVCIKVNEDINYPMIPFQGVYDAIFDIEDFKSLRKAKEEIGNYKVLIQELPLLKDASEINSFAIDFNNMILFHNRAAEALPDGVGLITSPMKITDVSFDKVRADTDNVANSERDFWSASGVSQLLFNADKAGSIGLDKSIKTDEMMVLAVVRQIQRWINRKIKFVLNNVNFRVNMLDLTTFNVAETFDRASQAAQYGFPVKSIVGATLGLTPSSLVNMAFLENDMLGLHTQFIPLSSSHTASGGGSGSSNDGGRPTQGDNITSEGLKARDQQKGGM